MKLGEKNPKMKRGVMIKGVIIIIIAILSFVLAKNFYNDPLLMGGIELFGVPLYIVVSFFFLLYIVYRIIYFCYQEDLNNKSKKSNITP